MVEEEEVKVEDVKKMGVPERLETTPKEEEEETWMNVTEYGWAQGEITDPWVYVTVNVRGEEVTCDFGVDSFDLKIRKPVKSRFKRGALDRDLEPERCKYIVKKDKIVLKLRKRPATNQIDGEPTRYPKWDSLAKRGGKREKDIARAPREPGSQYFDVVKAMYENGDEAMRKRIGDVVYKNRRRETDYGPDPLGSLIGDQDEIFLEKCRRQFVE